MRWRRKWAGIIAEKRPTIVLTYGLDGVYGHPDHITVHKSPSLPF